NPAKDVTSISYAIDKNTANAQIVITDMAGRTLQQINITDGAGNVNINTNNFANGAYIYSLVIDGQTVESKQMVVNK
ncbi:MAG TPA: T9SS type A sorting domain-containing protein, partial [Chitinophagales bacterium]|nr:T9SS type A sorting domain-containing protein [Chitinophagales bacterium]